MVMDWHSIEGHRLLYRAFPLRFVPVRGCRTVGGWTVVAVTRRYVDFCRPEGPGQAPASFRHYFEHDPRRHRPKTTALDMGEMLPLPDTQDPATWAALLAHLWRVKRRTGAEPDDLLPAGLALCAPPDYGETWALFLGVRYGTASGGYVELPILYGDAQWWREEQAHYAGFPHATCDPTEALIYALIALQP